jgi:hypothetical protein
MNSSFILYLFGALIVGGLALFAWPVYGPCLTHDGEIELTMGHSASVACDQADLRFADWSHGSTLEMTCADNSSSTLHLAESSPTGEACGVSFELLDHWEGGPRTEHQIAIAFWW